MGVIRNPLHLEVVPAPGTWAEWGKIEERIQQVLPFAESIQIDICDGKFAPNTTWMDPAPFAKYTKQAKFEVHLMVDNPLQYVKPFADAGFVRFLGHVEKMPDVAAFLAEAQLWGEAGLAFDGPTELSSVQVNWNDVDVALFYTGERIGFSNGTMVLDRLEKVKQLRALDADIAIEIDGGVNDANIVQAKEAGVTRFASTGFLFDGKNTEEQFHILENLLHQR